MSMSKNQIVMAAIGGVTLVAAAALGYLAFDAYSSKSEAVEERDGAAETVKRLLRAEVSPDKESELAYKKNADTLAGWTEAALATAAAGDRAVRDDLNPAAFKKKIVDEARALAELEGEVEGKVVKAGFNFGLPDFVTGDKLPEQELLPKYQRLWGDVRLVFELLQECGVAEIVRIEPAGAAAAPSAQPKQEEKPKARNRNRAKRDAEVEKPTYTVEKYAVDFRARPAALVKAVNALATSSRFIVVDSMEFAREGDMIAAALGEGEKTRGGAQEQSAGERRHGRRKQKVVEEAEKPAEESEDKKGLVNDPAKESPFLVKMTLSTYDFGSAAKKPAAGEDAAEGAPEEGGAEAAAESKEGEE